MKLMITSNKNINITKIQNILGKYLYNKLDGSYSLKKTSTGCEIESTILYQIPSEITKMYDSTIPEDVADVHEMNIEINITTYSNNIRVNIIAIDEQEENIMTKTFKTDIFENMQQGLDKVYQEIIKSITRKFKYYEILF